MCQLTEDRGTGQDRRPAPHDATAMVPACAESVPATRAFLVALLRGWDISSDDVDDAALLVTELVTNAIEHGKGAVTVQLSVLSGVLHVAVTDHGAHIPHQLEADLDAEGGRGLWLVEAVAVAWGTTPLGTVTGKTVWFELRVVSAPSPRC